MRITFLYVCTDCDCEWTQTMRPVGMSFIDGTCTCPSCHTENEPVSQELS